MSGGITVKEFKYIPGVNDAEYIRLLEEHRKIDRDIINKAVAKIKSLSAELRERPEIIHCKDCKHHWTHRCMDSMPREICDLNQTFYDADYDFCSLAERSTE